MNYFLREELNRRKIVVEKVWWEKRADSNLDEMHICSETPGYMRGGHSAGEL